MALASKISECFQGEGVRSPFESGCFMRTRISRKPAHDSRGIHSGSGSPPTGNGVWVPPPLGFKFLFVLGFCSLLLTTFLWVSTPHFCGDAPHIFVVSFSG